MKKSIFILGLLTILSIGTVFGQQDAQYTQYMYNMNILNPAYAGSRDNLNIGLLGRTQWVGINGAPRTLTLSADGSLGRHVGLGVSAISDTHGPVKEQNIFADFSYTIKFSETKRLAFGVKAGASFLNVDLSSLSPNDPEVTDLKDINEVYPNIGAGAYYYTNHFYVGLSVPNFIESEHKKESDGVVSTASDKMHYFLTSGYVFDVSEDLKLKPSVMLKAVFGAPLSVDLSANMLLYDKLEAGLSYRFDESISAMVGFQVSTGIRIGYAYDYTLTNLGDFNSGTHEIMLLFELGSKKLLSPRFF